MLSTRTLCLFRTSGFSWESFQENKAFWENEGEPQELSILAFQYTE